MEAGGRHHPTDVEAFRIPKLNFGEPPTREVASDPPRRVRHARWHSTCRGHYVFLMYEVEQSPRSIHKKCARRTWCCAKTTSIHQAPSLSCQRYRWRRTRSGGDQPRLRGGHGPIQAHKGKPRAALLRPVGRAAPQAKSLAQLPGEAGGLWHTSENRPGATVHGRPRPSMGDPDPP